MKNFISAVASPTFPATFKKFGLAVTLVRLSIFCLASSICASKFDNPVVVVDTEKEVPPEVVAPFSASPEGIIAFAFCFSSSFNLDISFSSESTMIYADPW